MYGIYFFEDKKLFDGELRQEFSKIGATLDYENCFHKFLTKITNFKPSFVVLDYTSPLLTRIFEDIFSANSNFFVPFVMVLSGDENVKLINLPNCKNINKKDKKTELKTVFNQITNLVVNDSFWGFKKESKNQDINKVLNYFQFSSKFNGTLYLKDALRLYVNEDMRSSKSVSNILEQVALIHNTKSANVERCLRSLSMSMWNNDNANVFHNFFIKKPSTKELVRSLAEYIFDSDFEDETKIKNVS